MGTDGTQEDAPQPTSTSSSGGAVTREGSLALRNALKLAASLILTWSVALIVAFKLPNYLGADRFGEYGAAQYWSLTLAVFVGFGVDTYIQREIPVRPEHASEFFFGVTLLRLAASMPLFAIGAFVTRADSTHLRIAAALFGVAQIFVTFNETFAKMLQASSKVGGLAVSNVLAKLLWGGGTFVLVALKVSLPVLVVPFLASELLKTGFLFIATRGALNLDLRLDLKVTRAVLVESVPFFVATAAVSLGNVLDVTTLNLLHTPKNEIGFYTSAKQIANLSALLSPIVSGVLIPMMRRAKERSTDEFYGILRRCLEGVIVIAVPGTLLLALGAEFWLKLALRPEFQPAAASLRYLAPTFVFAYGNVLLWLALMIEGRSWTITVASVAGVIALPIFVMIAVPLTRKYGAGSAGMGAAIALSSRELLLIIAFFYLLGRRSADARSISAFVRSLLICAVVSAMHLALARLGPLRLALDALVYVVLGLALRVFRISDGLMVLRLVKNRGR
jgi:O-antigen/teichoic acid export membrane protein